MPIYFLTSVYIYTMLAKNNDTQIQEPEVPQLPVLNLHGEKTLHATQHNNIMIQLTELHDRHAIKWVIQNFDTIKSQLRQSVFEDGRDPLKRCKAILKSLKPDGTLVVTYERSQQRPHGRMYAKGIGGLQNLPRELRHTFAKNMYWDVDMINTQPVLLTCLAEKFHLDCTFLRKYVRNRDSYLNMIVSCNPSITRDEAKVIVLSIINGGSKQYNALQNKPEWLMSFKYEMDSLLKELPIRYPEEYALRKKFKKGNYNASTVNSVLCEMEHQCLMNAVHFFETKGFRVDVWMFDGFMVRSSSDMSITEGILRETEEYVLQQTGYPMKFAIKPMDQGISLPPNYRDNIPSNDLEYFAIDHDKHAAEYVLSIHGDKYKRCGNRFFYKEDGIWVEDNSVMKSDMKQVLMRDIMNMNIVKLSKDEESTVPYSKNIHGATNVAKAVVIDLPNDPDFLDTIWQSNLKTLTFKNGIYSFADNQFYPDGLSHVYTTIRINRNYSESTPEMVQEVYDKLLDPILWDKDQQSHFLTWAARGLAGEYTEKTWGVMMGLRNSGKGVLVEAFLNAFGKYVTNFNAECWICRGNSDGDEAKKMSWIIDHEFTRLNFSNELRLIDDKGKELTLDGAIPKKLASGGDYIICRKNYKDEQKVRPQGRFMLMVNEINKIKPDDAKETAVFFDMNTVFKKEITPEDERITKLGQFHIRKADNTIKEHWLKRQDVLDAFTHIVLSHYTAAVPDIPDTMKKDVEEFRTDGSLASEIKSYVRFTGDFTHKITTRKLNEAVSHLKISAKKLKKELVFLGALYDNKHGLYKGIEIIIPESDSVNS